MLEVVDSTQDEAHRLALTGAPHGTTVIARRQEEGRGARGQAWVSEEGGVWVSVVARPTSGDAIEVLSLRVGLIAASVLDPWVAPATVRLKWPNDLMLNDRKVGGILCEARWQAGTLGWVAVGLGVNIVNLLPPALAAQATTLSHHFQPSPQYPVCDVELIASTLAARVAEGTSCGGALTAKELEGYARRDWLAGRTIVSPLRGRVLGIGRDGGIRVAPLEGDEARREEVVLHSGPVR